MNQLLVKSAIQVELKAKKVLERVVNEERGDVPGWVLVTLMTAGICVALWAVAEDAIIGLFQRAIDSVTNGR